MQCDDSESNSSESSNHELQNESSKIISATSEEE